MSGNTCPPAPASAGAVAAVSAGVAEDWPVPGVACPHAPNSKAATMKAAHAPFVFMVPQLRGLRRAASPRQAVDDLVRLADDIAHDLACGLAVADQAAGLARP